ncbi:NUDIX hydrolase [candidate division KSB1 bacterium]
MDPNDALFEEIVEQETLYQGKYLDLRKMTIRLPDKRTGIREIVQVKDAVAVIPVDAGGNVHLVRQHRPAIGRTIVEIPAGLIDDGENADESARRECEEETGYRPQELIELITYAHAEGYSTGFITLYLGYKLERTGKIHLDQTEFLEHVVMPFDELLGKVRKNEFIDSKTILATLLAGPVLPSLRVQP